MRVLNFHGAPCSGKTTKAAEIFVEMKKRGYDVELVIERSKELIYEGSGFELNDEHMVFAEKRRRIKRFDGKVDFVITDSPLFYSCFYGKHEGQHFIDYVISEYHRCKNTVFRLERIYEYNPAGRNPDESDADENFKCLDSILKTHGFPIIEATEKSATELVDLMLLEIDNE